VKNLIKEYFTFNSREKRGLIILTSIIVILLLILLLQVKFITPSPPPIITGLEAQIASTENDSSDREEITTYHKYSEKKPSGKTWNSKSNTRNQDLITPRVSYRTEPRYEQQSSKSGTRNTKTIIELNSADSLSLVSLRGIGPAFATRIIKYRNLLGGFYKREQLLEVYGFTPEMLSIISDQINIDSEKVNKININKADFNALKTHPYIKYNNAKLILNYRNAHGNYNSIDDIKNIHVISDTTYNKLSSYITIQ
jgi:competence protein ComEA